MIYNAIINYLVLYITLLKTPVFEISGVIFEPHLRVFVSPVVAVGVFGHPILLIIVMPLLLTLRL